MSKKNCRPRPEWRGYRKEFDEFNIFLGMSSQLFYDEVDEFELKRKAEELMNKLTLSQKEVIGNNWKEFYSKTEEFLPLRMRAGIKRGYDILIVASMSRD